MISNIKHLNFEMKKAIIILFTIFTMSSCSSTLDQMHVDQAVFLGSIVGVLVGLQ